MKTEWDYSELADAYLTRPAYAEEAIEKMLELAGLENKEAKICDIGAGVGHLTIPLARRGYNVVALEPNDSMRGHLVRRVSDFDNVEVQEAVAEETGQDDGVFSLVTFGSSFNVTDRQRSLKEVSRILGKSGWFACMWNHRNLEDPLQKSIEKIIHNHVDSYSYGTRREDQTGVIQESGLFDDVQKIEASMVHEQTWQECAEAWRSHATLQRQAKDKFPRITEEIELLLKSQESDKIQIPYTTRIWMAPLK